MPQTPMTPQDKVGDGQDIVPVYGRAGRGSASIVPHLSRQQRINDKPAADRIPAQRHPSDPERKPGS